MPGADGFELIRRIRRGDSGRRALPAVAITGLSGKECALALAADYQACLTKPVDPSFLADTILRLVKRSRKGKAAR